MTNEEILQDMHVRILVLMEEIDNPSFEEYNSSHAKNLDAELAGLERSYKCMVESGYLD
jgi:hypothetical protein